MKHLRAAIAALLLAAVFGLGACGGDRDETPQKGATSDPSPAPTETPADY